jgi:hypothetical protein
MLDWLGFAVHLDAAGAKQLHRQPWRSCRDRRAGLPLLDLAVALASQEHLGCQPQPVDRPAGPKDRDVQDPVVWSGVGHHRKAALQAAQVGDQYALADAGDGRLVVEADAEPGGAPAQLA